MPLSRSRRAWPLALVIAVPLLSVPVIGTLSDVASTAASLPGGDATVVGTSRARATRSPSPVRPTCAALAASMSRSKQVGQLFMVGVSSAGLAPGQADVLARAHAGSVVFLGNSTAGVAAVEHLSGTVRAAAGHPHGVGVLVAVDQEGGLVQRLKGPGFDVIPSARKQAGMSDAALRTAAARWARQLRRAGVDANLAPVADVVPAELEQVNRPIGVLHRGFGPHPAVVARKVGAVVTGMDRGGIATAVKHFPGLGRVRGNTDHETHVVDDVTVRHDPDLAGFAAGVSDGVDLVMVSSASYPRIDPDHRAVFSSVVMRGLLRHDLSFGGVVVSDDLAATALQDTSPGHRVLEFLRSGGDLAVVGDPTLLPAMTEAVRARAASHPAFAAAVTAKAARVLQLKARRGLAPCR